MEEKKIETCCHYIQQLQDIVIHRNKAAGWWSDLHTGLPKERNKGELLMLIVTEVAECMENGKLLQKFREYSAGKVNEIEVLLLD